MWDSCDESECRELNSTRTTTADRARPEMFEPTEQGKVSGRRPSFSSFSPDVAGVADRPEDDTLTRTGPFERADAPRASHGMTFADVHPPTCTAARRLRRRHGNGSTETRTLRERRRQFLRPVDRDRECPAFEPIAERTPPRLFCLGGEVRFATRLSPTTDVATRSATISSRKKLRQLLL